MNSSVFCAAGDHIRCQGQRRYGQGWVRCECDCHSVVDHADQSSPADTPGGDT